MSYRGIHVKEFGAKGDGVTDDSGAIQNAMNECFNKEISKIEFGPGVYLVESSILLPKSNSGNVKHFAIEGNGATLKTTQPITIFDKSISDFSDPVNGLYWNPVIRNFSFEGTNSSNAIVLHRTAYAVIENCKMYIFNKGIELAFGLETYIRAVDIRSSLNSYRILSGDGVFTGGTPTNSSSNVTMLVDCRAQTQSPSGIGYYISHCGNIKLINCVCEGSYVDKALYAESVTAGGTHYYADLSLDGFWVEYTTAINKAFEFKFNRASVSISNFIHTTASCQLVDASQCTDTTIAFRNCSSWNRVDDNRVLFSQDAAQTNRWIFDTSSPTIYTTVNGAVRKTELDLFGSSIWESGIVPHYRGSISHAYDFNNGWVNVDTLSENSAWTAAGTTPPVVDEGTFFGRDNVRKTTFESSMTSVGYAGCRANYASSTVSITPEIYRVSVDVRLSRLLSGQEDIIIYYTGSYGSETMSLNANNSAAAVDNWVTFTSKDKVFPGSGVVRLTVYENFVPVSGTLDVYISNPRLEKKAAQSVAVDSSHSTKHVGRWYILPDNDATPNIENYSYIQSSNTSGVVYTNLDSGEDGQHIHWLLDSNSTVQNNSNIKLDNSVNFSPPSGGMLHLMNRSNIWYEVSRAVY